MKKLLLGVLACTLCVSTAFAADDDLKTDKSATSATAEQQPPKPRLISLDFPETSLSTVLDVLSLKTGRKFITDSDLARKKIVFNLRDVTPDEALAALLDTYNLYYIRQGSTNIYVIKNKTDQTVTLVSKVLFLNYSSAKEMEGALKSNLTKNGTLAADDRTNTLIVTDMADNIDKIEALVRTLDTPPLQVLLEAKIVDVKLDNSLSVGTDINNLYRTNKYTTSPLDLQRQATVGTSLSNSSVQPEMNFSQLFAPGLAQSGKLKVSILQGDYNIDATIEALKKDSNAKLLTNPRLLVINNQEATIDIVEEIPYQERTFSSGGTETVSTQFKTAGIKLKVKPQINRDGSIVLNVVPEQSYRTGETMGNVPIISTSKANTTFMLRNGETAVIGGLIRESDSNTEYKVPLVGDIPILGALFKRVDKSKVRTELTIFITAKVVQK